LKDHKDGISHGSGDDGVVAHRFRQVYQYNPERLILILYSNVQLRVMAQIINTKDIKLNQLAWRQERMSTYL
jgi:hypothetical protein